MLEVAENRRLAHSVSSIKETDSKRKADKKTFWQIVVSHVRRITIEFFNLFFNHDFVFRLIGVVNQRVKIIDSVFLAYPANRDYALAYVYAYRLPMVRWNPWPTGIFLQNGKIGIMFVISTSNGEFRNPENIENLQLIAKRMEKIRKLFCAKQKTFAGILPGILFLKRMIRETYEADVTVEAIKQAIEKIKSDEDLNEDTPIIILGGRGFIGRRVVSALPKKNIYSVDIAENKKKYSWPIHLKSQRVILVNISLNSVLDKYIDLLWQEVIVLNEVYPEPSTQTIQRLKKIGCCCYHIVGVKAKSFPQFPHAYRGAIPCCATLSLDNMESSVFKII